MNCERCGGFKVFDYFYGPSICEGFRCINCGAITDMRLIHVRPPERSVPVHTTPQTLPRMASE